MTCNEEQTDTLYISTTSINNGKEHIAEVLIKDKGVVWYAVLRYTRLPRKSIIIRDTYAYNCKSPRPYQPGQPCDSSITAPVYHLFNQLCTMMGLDPIELYNEAYPDHIFTQAQLDEICAFGAWQGVGFLYDLNQDIIDLVFKSIHAVNLHQLANALSKRY